MDFFPDIEKFHQWLEKISEEIPKEFYKYLSGGIILEEDIKLHPKSRSERPLYVLGEYRNFNIGRSIAIYYGSFKRAYGYEEHSYIYEKLREALIHEFTHHLGSLSGRDKLKQEDEKRLREYKNYFYKNDN